MADKNIFEKLFLEAENTNLQVLMDNALNEKRSRQEKKCYMQFIRMRLIKNRTNYLKTKSLLFEKKVIYVVNHSRFNQFNIRYPFKLSMVF